MEEHSTKHYDIPGLVLRRGQKFSFTVTFNRDYDVKQHQLYVRLTTGSRSMISKHTQIRLLVDGTENLNGWSVKSLSLGNNETQEKNNRISLEINSPSDAIIGKYSLLLEVRPIKKDEKDVLNKPDFALFLFEVDIYLLFNPWNKDDACALSSSEQIDEYVMNEHGQIYLGSTDKPRAVPWYFGQFERSALLAALTLLDKAQLPPQNRIDPSIILRIISSKICSNPGTNNGIFPSSSDRNTFSSENHGYTSSTGILKQYVLSNGRPVQGANGTNWQHAAILCSLSRALGIPCRIVTIYNAACQTDGTENYDIHWDIKQRPLKQLNSDLICASHVWNECWMRRDDLSNGEHDWQIIDSTPVLMCDGIRRTGPCSVSFLKNSELGFRWDSPFVHSTINGNKAHWNVYPDGNMELLDVQENIVGSKIITRSLTNEFEIEDITENYKNLMKSSDRNGNFVKRPNNDVDFELKLSDDMKFGDNLTLQLHATNKSNETRTIATALSLCIISSSHQKLISCYDQPIQLSNLGAGKNENIPLKIRPEQYMAYGKAENIIVKYYIHSQIKETSQIFTRDDSIVFNKDDLVKLILNEDVIEAGKPALLEIQIANTLQRRINNGRIHIDGLGINQIIPVNRAFALKESATFHVKLTPTRVGVSRLYVTFISDDVCSLTRTIPLEIVDGPIPVYNEPLLKTTAQPSVKADEKFEIKNEKKKSTSQLNLSAKPAKSPTNEDPYPLTSASSLSTIHGESHDTKTSDSLRHKYDSSSTGNDDDESELYFERKQSHLSRNNDSNSSLPHGSTLSLDKDKISIDSLDTTRDRRYASNNNNNQ
ncbi:unnamed protein product [Rotaria socialis]